MSLVALTNTAIDAHDALLVRDVASVAMKVSKMRAIQPRDRIARELGTTRADLSQAAKIVFVDRLADVEALIGQAVSALSWNDDIPARIRAKMIALIPVEAPEEGDGEPEA